MPTARATVHPLIGKPLGPHWSQLALMLARHRIDLVIDVGANIGQYACALRAAGYRGRILSIEPVAAACAALTQAARDDPDWIVAPRAAVGAGAGALTINVAASSDMSSALSYTDDARRAFPSDRFVAQETVDVLTIDMLLAQHGAGDSRVFLKSDTQGYDLEVLRGAAGSLGRIVGAQVETALCPIYLGQPMWTEIVDFLSPYDFDIHFVIPGYFSRAYGRLMEMDLVFFR